MGLLGCKTNSYNLMNTPLAPLNGGFHFVKSEQLVVGCWLIVILSR